MTRGSPTVSESVEILAEAGLRGLLEDQRNTLGDGPYWLVLEGDWGGQIYLTVPWHRVGPESRIRVLLKRMNALAWSSNEGDGASAYLTTGDIGVSGGMGGGRLGEKLWLHKEFLGEPTSWMQTAADELRGATCEQVKAMDWVKVASELLDLW